MPECPKRPGTICRQWSRPDPRIGDGARVEVGKNAATTGHQPSLRTRAFPDRHARGHRRFPLLSITWGFSVPVRAAPRAIAEPGRTSGTAPQWVRIRPIEAKSKPLEKHRLTSKNGFVREICSGRPQGLNLFAQIYLTMMYS